MCTELNIVQEKLIKHNTYLGVAPQKSLNWMNKEKNPSSISISAEKMS